MVKAFILDLDGTLINSTSLYVASFKPVLTKYKLEVNPELLKKYFGMIAEDIISKAFPELSSEMVKTVVSEKRRLFLDNISLIKKHKCADEFLKKINSKGVVALFSSSHKNEIKAIINHLGWNDYFSLLLDGYDIPAPKPAPDGLIKAMKLLGVNESDSVYVGDTIYDALAARSAHIGFAGVTTGTFSKKDFNELGFKKIYKNLCLMKKYFTYWKP